MTHTLPFIEKIWLFSCHIEDRHKSKVQSITCDFCVTFIFLVYLSRRSEKQDDRPCLWLAETFSTSPLKPLIGIPRKLIGSKISTSTKFVFFRPIRKTRWPSWPLIGWYISDFSETAERNTTKLDRKQDLNVLYQVCVFQADQKIKMATLAFDWLRHFRLLLNRWTEFKETWQEARSQRPLPIFVFFRPIGKTRWPPWPLIGWNIFDFFDFSSERNSTELDWKKYTNVLYQVCVFRSDRKNKMASDWLRHFRFLLHNCWAEFNETWQQARSECPLPKKNSGRSEKQDGRPGLWLAEIFSTSSLKPLNGIERNLTRTKISMSSTKFVFFRPMGKQAYWEYCKSNTGPPPTPTNSNLQPLFRSFFKNKEQLELLCPLSYFFYYLMFQTWCVTLHAKERKVWKTIFIRNGNKSLRSKSTVTKVELDL